MFKNPKYSATKISLPEIHLKVQRGDQERKTQNDVIKLIKMSEKQYATVIYWLKLSQWVLITKKALRKSLKNPKEAFLKHSVRCMY